MVEHTSADNKEKQSHTFCIDNPEPGRYSGVPDTDYFAAPAVNASTLKHMGRSALHCKAQMTRSGDRPDTEAQKVGRLVHCAVLEPERFAADYVREPTVEDFPEALVSAEDYKAKAKALDLKVGGSKDALKDRITEHLNDQLAQFVADHQAHLDCLTEKQEANYKSLQAGNLFFDDIVADQTHGKTPLKADHWYLAQAIIESLAANPKAAKALSGGVAEETLVWRDVLSGLLCKSRMDYYREDLGLIVDVKTTEDARPEAVARDIHKYGYHISAAHYLDGLQALDLPGGQSFAWVFVEKKPPHAIGLYFASEDMIERARELHREQLSDFARCKVSGIWPAYPGEFQTIDLPAWA
jgi:hypothetical protein